MSVANESNRDNSCNVVPFVIKNNMNLNAAQKEHLDQMVIDFVKFLATKISDFQRENQSMH